MSMMYSTKKSTQFIKMQNHTIYRFFNLKQAKLKRRILFSVFLLIASVFLNGNSASAQTTYQWIGATGGSWAVSTNWNPTRTTPATNDVMQFDDGGTYTVTAVPTQTIGKLLVTNNSTITLQSAGTATISINGPTATNNFVVANGSALTLGSVSSFTIRYLTTASQLGDISGTLTVATGNTFDPANVASTIVTVSATGIIVNSGGTVTGSATALVFAATSNYNHTGNGSAIPTAAWNTTSNCTVTGITNSAVTVPTQTYGNFTWNNTAQTVTVTIGSGTVAFAGLLNIQSGTLTVSSPTFNANGATQISGTLTFTSSTGNKSFADLTINSGGTFNNTAAPAITISGNLQNDGTFNASTSVYTLSGTGKTISGTTATLAIPSLTITGTYTNNVSALTVATALAGAGTLTMGSNTTLNLTGTTTITGLNCTANTPNTIVYNLTTGTQTIKGTPYYNLTIAKTGQTGTLGAATTVNNNLTVTGGTLADGGFLLTGPGAGSGTLDFSTATVTALTLTNTTANPFPAFQTNLFHATASTVNFNAGATQNIPALTYGNFATATSGVKTIQGTTVIQGNLTIGSLTTFAIGANALTVSGTITTSGTFSGGTTSDLTLDGTVSASLNAISGNLRHFTVNKTSGGTVTTNSTLTVNGNLTVTSGTLINAAQITGTATGLVNIATGATWQLGNGATAVIFPSAFTSPNITFQSNSTIAYGSTAAQTVSAIKPYENLSIINGSTKTIAASITVNNNLTVGTGATLADGGFQINGNATGLLTLQGTGALTIGTTNTNNTTFPANFITANISLASTSTVTYNANAAQDVSLVPSSYGNLTLTSTTAQTKTILSNLLLTGSLTVSGSTTLNIGSNNVTANGNALVTGSTSSVTGSGRVILTGGSAPHQINGGGAAASFSNLELNDATQGATLVTGNTAISGTLTMTAGTMLLNNLTLTLNGDVTGSGLFSSAVANTGSLIINGTGGGSAGTINMAASPNNVIPTFTLNRTGASSSVTIGTATIIKTALNLTNGIVNGSANLTLGTGTAVTLTTTKVNGSLDAAPAFNLTGVTYNVTYGNAVATATINSGSELPATINTLTITNPTNGVNLNSSVTCSTGVTLTNGRLFLGNNDLTITFTAAIGGSPSVSNMIVADAGLGTGQLKKIFQTGVTAAYTLTVGTTTGTPVYSPVSLNFTANSTVRTVGVNVTAGTPPNNGAITNYINRYWTFTESAGGTYTYTPVFTFVAGDVVGTATLTYLNRYNGSTWTQYGTASSATTATQAGLTETTGTLGGNVFSSRQEASATYTWNATSGSADYTVAANWTPNRTTLSNNDILQFSNGGSSTATNVPTQTIGRIIVSGNTNIALSSSALNQTLTFGGLSTGLNLDVQAGSTLQLSSAGSNNTILTYTAGTQTASIAGTFIINSNTSLNNTYIATNAITTVTGTVTNFGGAFTSTSTNFLMAAGSLYNHSSNQTTLPIFGWNLTSTCNINGFTTATSLAAGSQSFGNFTFNSALSTGSVNAVSSLLTINGNFTIINTGSFELRLVSTTSSTITIGGNLDLQGGTLTLSSSTGSPTVTISGDLLIKPGSRFAGSGSTGSPTVNLAGNFNQTGGIFDNLSTGLVTFNFTGNGKTFSQTGTFTPTNYNFNINTANASLTLNNNFPVASTRTFTVSNGTLFTGAFLVTGAGNFTLPSSTNATLGIGDVAGIITGTGLTGSIQVTGSRSYGTTANYIYNGSAAQVTGNGLTTCNNLTIDNAAGVTQANAASTTQNVTVTNQLTLTSGIYTVGGGAGQLNTLTLNGLAILPLASTSLATSSFSNLVFGSTAAAGVYIPSSVSQLNALTGNNTNAAGVVMNSSITLNATATALTLGGRLFIGNNDLTITSTTGTISGGSSPTIMVVADGTGQLKKTFGTGATGAFTFPVGDGNTSFDYSPFAITFSANSATRVIGVRVTDATHPQMNSNGVQTDFVSRYWTLTDDQAGVGTYSYTSSSLTYSTVSPTDVNGTPANYKINRWDGANWSQLNSTVSAPTVTTSGTYNETSGTLGGNEFTLRVNGSQPYVWQPTSGSADFQVATNWSPSRFSPVITDILHFTNGGTSTATNVPAQIVARILVDNNTDISLQSAASVTLSINGPAATANLDIRSGSTLQLSSTGAIALTLNITTTASQLGSIAGTLVLNSNTSNNNTFTTSTVATTVVTVASGGAITNNGGTITSTAATLVFANGSAYNHVMNGGTIPTATYNPSSTLNITGTTTTNPSGFSGTFGNVTWNCAGQTSATGAISAAMTVNGNLTVSAGTLADAGVVITGNAAGTFSVASGATYTTTRSSTSWFPTNFIAANISLDDNSTFIYAGGLGHTIPSTPITSYGNLTLTGSVTKTLSATTLVRGSLTINTSNTLADGGFVITVNKNIANSGTHSGTGKILLSGGSVVHSLTGTGPYGNIELSDANGVSQGGSFTINNTLTLTSGSWSIGSNTLTLNGALAFTGGDFTGSATSNLTLASTGGSASIPVITNGLLNFSVSRSTVSTITLTDDISLAGNLTIALSNTLNDGGNILTVAGNSTNNSATGFTGTGKILFAGGSAAHSLSGTGPYTNFELDDVNNANMAASFTINGILSLTNGSLVIGANTLTLTGTHSAGGSGFFSGILASSAMVIGGTAGGNYGTLNFAPGGQTLSTFQLNRTGAGGSVHLGTPLTVNSTLTLSANGGLLYLDNNDLTLNGTAGGTPSVNAMVIADANNGTGQFKKTFNTGATSAFNFPVGDVDGTIDYSPFSITMSANSVQRVIGIIVNDVVHPQMNSNGVQVDYVSRYWSFTDSQSGVGTYSYSASSYTYSTLSPTDLNGTAANLKVNRWDGLNWIQLVSTVAAPTVSTSGTYNETSGTLGGNDFTLRVNGAQAYVWLPTSGSADWTVAANWSPSRFAPLVSDILNFTSGGTSTATNVPTQTIGKFVVDNNTDISLQSAAAGIILSVNGTTAITNLDVKAGSTLQLSSTGTSQITLNITTTASQLGNIAGTLILNPNTSSNNTFVSNTVTTTIVTIPSGGVITNNGGIVTGSAATLQFAGGSFYNHNMNAGTIPTATYNAASTVNITSPTSGPTAGANQTFGNLTLNMGTGTTSQTGTVTIAGTLTLSNGTYAVGANTLNLNGPNTAGTTSNISTIATSTLAFGGSAAGVFIPTGAASFGNLTLNNTNGISLANNVTVNSSTGLTFTSGKLFLGNFDFSFAIGSVSSGANATNHVVADATGGNTGQLKKTFNTGATVSFTFPVGDMDATADYSPFTITMSANSTVRTIGLQVFDDVHPQMNINGAQTDFVSRYWRFTDSQAGVGTYSYSASGYTYSTNSPADLNGTAANLKINRWNGSAWVQLTSSVAAPVVSTSGTFNETSGTFGGNDFTLRNNPAQTYTWLPTSGSADWTVASNWSPSRFVTAASDMLQFTSGGASVATNVPTQTIAKLTVDNNTDISLQSAASGITLSVNGPTATTNLSVTSGSILQLSSTGTNQITLNFITTASQQGNIAGTLVLNSNTSNNNTFNTSSVSTTVVTVASGGAITNNGGVVTSNAATLNFSSGSSYNHAMNAGTVPTAAWNAASTTNITSPATGPSAGVSQAFGNLTIATGAAVNTLMTGTVTVNGAYTQTSGSLGINNLTLNLNGTVVSGAGTLSGSATAILSVGGTGNMGGALSFTTGAQTIRTLTLNRTSSGVMNLGSDLTVSLTLTLTNGLLNIGSGNLTLPVGSSIAGTPSVANMIVADGTGQLIRGFAAGVSSFTYPIGDATPNYTPVTLSFSANATAGTVGINGTNSTEPNNNTPSAPYAYLSRYWTFSNTNLTTYTYTGTFKYPAANLNGPENELRLSRWTGSAWYEHPGSSSASNLITITSSLNETTAPLTGDFTGRTQEPCIAPTLTAEANGNAVSSSVCNGGSVNLTAVISGGSGCTGVLEYAWSNGTNYWNGTAFASATPVFNAAYNSINTTTVINTTYTLTERCSNSTSCTSISSVDVVVNPSPITFTPPNPGYLVGGSIQIVASATSAFGGLSYVWSPSTGLNTTTSDTVIASPTTTTTYTVTATDLNGCSVTGQVTVSVDNGDGKVACGYNYSSFSSGLTYISGGTTLATGTATNGPLDDVSYPGVSLGFTFDFNGKTYTSVGVNTNGFVWFGTTTPGGATYNAISSASGVEGIASIFGNDLIGNLDYDGIVLPSLKYTTTGIAPNRIFTVQWLNMDLFPSQNFIFNTDVNRLDFQIKLYEGSNHVEFVYTDQNMFFYNTSRTKNVAIGLRGLNNSDFNDRTQPANAFMTVSSTSAGTANTSTVNFTAGCYNSGTFTFRYTPTIVTPVISLPSNPCDPTVTLTSSSAPVYQWFFNGNPIIGATNQTYDATQNGDYAVAISNGSNCYRKSATLNLNSINAGPQPLASSNAPVCVGSSVVLDAGLTGMTTYSWTGPNSFTSSLQGPSINNAQVSDSGTYTVTVTNAAGCTGTSSTFILVNPNPILSITSQTNVSCNGGSDGSVTIAATDGTPAYLYDLDGSSNLTGVYTGLSAGNYSASVIDDYGCEDAIPVDITEPDAISIVTSFTEPSCNGDADGSLTVTASGGTGTLQYSNDGGATYQASNVFTGLTAGTYSVFVKDANNCTASTSETITEPTVISISTSQTNVSCNAGNDGSITVTASGGTGTLQYSDDGGNSYQGSNIFTGLSQGTYSIFVKDANNCTASTSVTITEPTAISISTSQTNVSVNGGNDGSITVTASGGTPSYQYSNDGGSNYQASNVFNNLTAGTYIVVVQDANNCTASTTVIITEPAAISVSTAQTDVSCNGGSDGTITVTATGGTAPIEYSKDGGANYQASNLFTGLTAGTYSIFVKDANNNTASTSVTITEPPAISVSTSQVNVSCNGGNDGSITVTASGGTGTLQYSDNGGSTYQASNLFSNLVAGTYSVFVKDANNCTSSASVTITEPAVLAFTTSVVNVSCPGSSDGSITVNATGGTTAYQYSKDNGTSYQSSNIFTGLTAGNYNIVVKDANNCITSAASVTVGTVTDATAPIPDLATLPNVTGECSATVTVTPTATDNCTGSVNGTTSDPLTYNTQGTFIVHWSYDDGNGNTSLQNQTVIVDDITNPVISNCPVSFSSCNPVTWTPPTATDNCGTATVSGSHTPGTNFPAGTTTVTYTADDGNGNTVQCSFDVTVIPAPTAAISGDNTICLGQPTTLHLIFTGTGPWNYTISDGTQVITGSSTNNPDDINITPLTAGNHVYTVTILSDANCTGTGSGSATIIVNSIPPSTTITSISGTADACSGDVKLITANTTGGSGFNISWNTGTSSSVVKFSDNSGGPFVNGPFTTTGNTVYAQFGALVGGTGYNVCAQAFNACGSSANVCRWIRGKVSVPGTITGSSVACSNDVKNYACGVSAGAAIYTWTFSVAGAVITNNGTQNVQVTFPTFTSGQLCVTAALACGGSSTSAPRCLTVTNAPVIPGNFTSGPSKVCPGATNVLFTVPASNYATGYNWTVPPGCTIVSGQNTTSVTVNFPNPYTGAPPVCVYATSACASSAGRCKTVGSNIPVTPGAMAGPTTGVCNSTVQYSVPNSPGATSYTWTIPAGSTNLIGQGTTAIQFQTASNFNTGQVTVVANTTLCTPGSSSARTITINGKPATPGVITANPLTWCAGAPVSFSVTPASPLPNYSWTVTNGTITGGQGTANMDMDWGTGSGFVRVAAYNTCGSSVLRSQTFTSTCREEDEPSASELQITVYPNPAHDKVTASIYVKEQTQFNITLRDISGRVIISEDRESSEGLNAYDINLKGFAKGIYVLEIQSANESRKTKIVVE